jgi:hypothetical protein
MVKQAQQERPSEEELAEWRKQQQDERHNQ